MKKYSVTRDFYIFTCIPWVITGLIILIYVFVTSKSDTHIFEYFLGPIVSIFGIIFSLLYICFSYTYILDDNTFIIKRFNKEIINISHKDICGISELEKNQNYFTVYISNIKPINIYVNIYGNKKNNRELYKELKNIVLKNIKINS